jgi:hypothetical protein
LFCLFVVLACFFLSLSFDLKKQKENHFNREGGLQHIFLTLQKSKVNSLFNGLSRGWFQRNVSSKEM